MENLEPGVEPKGVSGRVYPGIRHLPWGKLKGLSGADGFPQRWPIGLIFTHGGGVVQSVKKKRRSRVGRTFLLEKRRGGNLALARSAHFDAPQLGNALSDLAQTRSSASMASLYQCVKGGGVFGALPAECTQDSGTFPGVNSEDSLGLTDFLNVGLLG
ncbi:hypothetical protein CRENBAI_021895 [Crenichthys baileyi]|uniref:Uncharacterized protein n=1 Tax=Crenichthys baileyi TaxID=28760 RepID=A0AAV9SRP5_9TELE